MKKFQHPLGFSEIKIIYRKGGEEDGCCCKTSRHSQMLQITASEISLGKNSKIRGVTDAIT
jgi:hypothetical protein